MPLRVADKNYFELFGLPAVFDLDLADLAMRYRESARQVHPDRYASGSDQERRLAMQVTALVNEAFQTLKEPITRAQYLLRLRGVDMGGDTDTAMDSAFLVEQIELRERLEDALHSAQAKQRLTELAAQVQQRMDETTHALSAQLEPGTNNETARRIVRELQFLDKLRRQIADMEEELV